MLYLLQCQDIQKNRNQIFGTQNLEIHLANLVYFISYRQLPNPNKIFIIYNYIFKILITYNIKIIVKNSFL